MQTSQEHFTTIVYAKFGGQTDCIMGNWKIENQYFAKVGIFIFLARYHERTQGISTVSMSSGGDFCFAVEAGVNLSSAVSVTVTSLIVGIGKCCYLA